MVILLCDSSKFGKSSYVKLPPMDKSGELITGSNIEKAFIKQFKGMNTRLTIV